jgi:hypothetical protein
MYVSLNISCIVLYVVKNAYATACVLCVLSNKAPAHQYIGATENERFVSARN